ncbi:ATP-binding protein [Candidatus Saccharibacteria bacterium]|nr:ATP-binding protein [Candidatus Saccharibacteria bacterium]
MIKAIYLNMENNYTDANGHPLSVLFDLKKFNVFVGENNSGKSRFVRSFLLRGKSIPIGSVCNNTRRFYDTLIKITEIASQIKNDRNIQDINFDFNIAARNDMDDYLKYKYVVETIYTWYFRYDTENPYYKYVQEFYDKFHNELMTLTYLIMSKPRNSVYDVPVAELYNGSCFYIPVLRGIEGYDSYFNKAPLHTVDDALLKRNQWQAIDEYAANSKQIYQNKISNAYGIKIQFVFTAENLYEEIKDKLLGNKEQREQIKQFQEFISEQFYNGDDFLLLPRYDRNMQKEYLAVKIGNNDERPLYDLGDGIKQMITILYKVFEKKDDESIFVIEEPEINLHPGYQRKLITTLNSDIFPKHQYFIVTHSNHVIESVMENSDAAVFKISKPDRDIERFKVVKSMDNDVEILDLLGVSNGSVFMSNCLIFIEGMSDRILIQKYLEVFMKDKKVNYRENVNYAFIETGGGNIAHWSFLKDLDETDIDNIKASSFSNRSFIVCDNDDGKRKERKRKLQQMVGKDNFYELPVREIENTIKRNVLENTLFPNSGPDIKRNYNEYNINSGYHNPKTYMGTFIDGHYNLSKKYRADSGTIREKVQFAKKVSSNISSLDDLSDSAKELCEKLFSFIEKSNR